MKVGIHDCCVCVPCLEGVGPEGDGWREDIELSSEKEICLRTCVGIYRAPVGGWGRIGCSLAVSGEGKREIFNHRRSGVIHMMPLPCDAMGKTSSEVDEPELGSVSRAVCLGGTKI